MTRLLASLAVLTVLGPSAVAQAESSDRTALSEDVRVEAGERVDGDVVVVAAGAHIAGEVTGDVVVVAGDVVVEGSGVVGGDLVVTGGNLVVREGARLSGDRVEITSLSIAAGDLLGKLNGASSASPPAPDAPLIEVHGERSLSNPMALQPTWLRVTTGVLCSMLLLVLGHLFMWLFPERSRNLRRTIEASPGTSLAMGGLVTIGLTLVAILLFVSLVGWAALPLLAVGALALGTIGLAGLFEALGDRMPLPFRLRSRSADFVAGTFVFMALSVTWALGGLPGLLASVVLLAMTCAGLGASILSSAGKRPYSNA